MNNHIHKKTPAYIQLIAIFVLSLVIFVSCADNSAPVSTVSEGGSLAIIAPEPVNEEDYILIHGFLDTANSRGIPARLYTFDEDVTAAGYAERMIDDGCSGAVLVGCDEDAVSQFQNTGIPVITLLSEFEGVPSVLIDDTGFYSDVAEFMLEKLNKDGLESGTVLIYGAADSTALDEFSAVISGKFTVQEYSDGMSTANVCAVYAVSDTEGALSCVSDNKDVVVIGSDLEDGTSEQFENGLYALCAKPLYEAAAQSVISLDKLVRGNESESQTLRPVILTAESSGLNRYISERYRALLMFDVITPSPAPTVVVPTDEVDETEASTGTPAPTEEP